MYEKYLKQFAEMSQAIGNRADYAQGGGGNTSVKLDNELMAVKASGFKLKDMKPDDGFVVINYQKIRKYYDDVNLGSDTDFYKDSADFVKQNTITLPGLKEGMRASVEAGFHSLLYKYVIHTHSVYSNLLCCTKEGRKIADEMFGSSKYGYAWVPYITPGFDLTLGIKHLIDERETMPKIIFMESHGILVSSDDYEECRNLHEMVTDMILDRMALPTEFSYVGIEETGEDTFISKSEILKGYFKGTGRGSKWFEANILYPDQAAYLSGNVADGSEGNKININGETGEVIYRTNYKEALTMEESIVALAYILEYAKAKGLTPVAMKQEDIDFIKNWEGVKYRKTLLKK
ncbi:MAG TPA: class II aldolase/adducin family protein [Clostridia bacterium]|nr:class II aldolase/adducin family protein [Clostridia bacterium]